MEEPDGDLLSPEIQLTIIGAKAFHCPVRNGKEWGRPAVAVRQRLWLLSAEIFPRHEPNGFRKE